MGQMIVEQDVQINVIEEYTFQTKYNVVSAGNEIK